MKFGVNYKHFATAILIGFDYDFKTQQKIVIASYYNRGDSLRAVQFRWPATECKVFWIKPRWLQRTINFFTGRKPVTKIKTLKKKLSAKN